MRLTIAALALAVSACGSSANKPAPRRVIARPPEPAVEIDRTKDSAAVIARFGDPDAPPPPPPDGTRSDPKPIALPTHLSLLATHVGRHDGSITVIDRASGGGGLYGVGDRVPGVGTLVDVAPGAARFRDATGEMRVLRFEAASTATRGAATPAASTPSGPRTVSRSELQRAASDPGSAGARARVAKDGAITLSSVRRGSLAERLGFQRGDRIVSVAGVDLDSPDAALEAMRRVKHASSASVVVTRGGETLTLDFQLTD